MTRRKRPPSEQELVLRRGMQALRTHLDVLRDAAIDVASSHALLRLRSAESLLFRLEGHDESDWELGAESLSQLDCDLLEELSGVLPDERSNIIALRSLLLGLLSGSGD